MYDFSKIISTIEEYKCQSCQSIFRAREIKLIPIPDDFESENAVKCIDRTNRLVLVMHPSNTIGDKLMTCPRCGKIHTHGFESIRKKKKLEYLNTKSKPTIPEEDDTCVV